MAYHLFSTDASWTWFEAALIRTSDPYDLSTGPHWLRKVVHIGPATTRQRDYRLSFPEEVETDPLARRFEVISQEGRLGPEMVRSRWHISQNAGASREFRTMQVTWRDTDEDAIARVCRVGNQGIWNRSGEFVRLIERGDRVALMLKARVCICYKNSYLGTHTDYMLSSLAGATMSGWPGSGFFIPYNIRGILM
jgi:hypothetical protein